MSEAKFVKTTLEDGTEVVTLVKEPAKPSAPPKEKESKPTEK